MFNFNIFTVIFLISYASNTGYIMSKDSHVQPSEMIENYYCATTFHIDGHNNITVRTAACTHMQTSVLP